jgi:RNA polymerase sigma factor (sigma-70 family)
MAGAQLGAALRQIQRLFSEGSSTGLSDTQLLAGFAARRDEAAFAALVAQHGPMVLAVCRGILRNPHDAEDAFQATFLVLARKAGSAWAEGQLGGWLHKVAYRIAIRARADATRRQALERRAAAEAAVEYTCDPLEDELRPALHEEVARLPAKLRLPVVLCYLEGLTHAQAAVALRCGEATVRRRLAKARERLRLRVARRGFEPSAAALGGALAKEAGAAVPPVCAEATVRAAIRVAAGEAAAAVVGTRVAHLTRGGMNLAINGWNMTVCVLLAVGAAVSLAAGITAGGDQSDKPVADRINPALTAKSIQSSPERSAVVEKPIAGPQAQAQTPPKTSRSHTTQGIVLGPDGKPTAGATVYWLGIPKIRQQMISRPRGMEDQPEDRPKTLATGMTGADGRFALTAEFDADTYAVRLTVVKAPGVGLSGRTSFSGKVKDAAGDGQGLTFRLRRPATIEGRLLTPGGAPAVGVKVLIEDFRDSDSGLEGERVASGPRGECDEDHRYEYWPFAWTTDTDGRFRIEGIVPEKMLAHLHFRHPDFADDDLFVSTGLPVSDWLREVNPVEPKFTHTLEPARPVAGVVTDKETGKPLPGVHVEMTPMRMQRPYRGNRIVSVRTDASGRYRAAGTAGDDYRVTAYPDPGSGYIPIEKRYRGWPAGAKVLEVNLAVSKGRVLRGRVVEAGSERPLAGASVLYKPEPGNPHNRQAYRFDNPVWTDGDGHFALTAVPGAGLLTVEAPTPGFISVSSTGQSTRGSSTSGPHGFARVDVPAENDEDPPVPRITLRRGVTLEARAVGPAGAPLDMVRVWCVERSASRLEKEGSLEFAGEGRFRLDGADPERTYRVFFLDVERRLGAVADLKYDPKGPAVVPLQPTATAKGIMVDPKDRPLQGAQLLLYMVLTTEQRELTVDDFVPGVGAHAIMYLMFTIEPLLQTYPAEFNYDNLIPGVRYYVGAYVDQIWSFHPIPPLKPGEVRDLGKIVTKPREKP